MKRIKKLLSLTLVAGLMLTIMTACGGGATTTAAPAETTTAAAAETTTAAAGGETTVAEVAETTVAADGALRIGLCLPDRDQYWTTFETAALKQVAEMGNIEAQVVEAKEDISTQLSQIETFKNNDFDAVIVGLTNNDSYQEALDASGDMKVVFFNRMVTDPSILDGKKSIYIGMSEYDAGLAQGRWLSEYFKDSGKTELNGVMFMGVLGLEAVTSRTQGCKDGLSENGFNVTWVFEDTAKWDRATAMNMFTQFLGAGKEFDFVAANNDEMALGVIEACTASGTEINFPVVGIDATETACLAIEEGTLKMTVNQNAILQGVETIKATVDLINGKLYSGVDPATFIFSTDAQAVTTDNVAEVLETFK